MTPRSLRRAVALCVIALALAVTGLGAADAGTSGGPLARRDTYPGAVAPGGYLDVHLSNTADGRIQVRWAGKSSSGYIKRWIVTTSTSRSMRQHAARYKLRATARSAVVPHASLVTPASGDYTFVTVTMVPRKRRIGTHHSPTGWIKAPVTVVPPGTAPRVTVGTFNVRTWNDEGPKSGPYSWETRRPKVVSTILESGASVVAIEEASGSAASAGGTYGDRRQWNDLVDGLGGSWAVTYPTAYKNAEDTLPPGRQGTRIVYDADKVALLAGAADSGSLPVAATTPKGVCWVPWAHFEDLATGKRFWFLSVHLTPGDDKASGPFPLWTNRNAQARAVIAKVVQLHAATPEEQVIVGGDLNSTIYTFPDNGVHRIFVDADFYDAFASPVVDKGQYPTTNSLRFPVAPSPHRRDYLLTYGPYQGSYSYENLAYTTATGSPYAVGSDHFMQVATLPIGPAA